MFNDIFKLLTEENEKLIKAVSFGLKCLFTFAFSSCLYKYFFGVYELISLTDFEALQTFVTSGRVFICILFTSTVHFILFLALPALTDFLFNLFESKQEKSGIIDRYEGELITRILRFMKMVDIRDRGRKIILMKRAELLYEYAEAFSTKDAAQKANRIMENFIFEIVHPYAVFCLYYFTLLDSQYKTTGLTTIVILFAVALLITNKGLSQMLELLCKSSNVILSTIEDGRIYNRTLSLLQQNFNININNEKKAFFDFAFVFGDKNIAVKTVPKRKSLSLLDAEFVVKKANGNQQHLIIISRNPISQNALNFLKENEEQATFISIQNSEDLEEKLTQIITTKYQTEA